MIGDVGASGGYWIACAADQHPRQPHEHRGLRSAFAAAGSVSTCLIARFGIDRRLYTAGGNKARLDPFLPERPEDVAFTQKLLDDLHVRFKAWVRERAVAHG